jgi:hypothetical protein
MDVGSIVSFLGNATTGGIIGALGGFISKAFEMTQQIKLEKVKIASDQARFEHEQKMLEITNKASELELQYNLKQVTTEAQMVFDTNAFQALKSAYDSDKASYATGDVAVNSKWFVFVDVARGLTRPLLTWGLDLAALFIVGYLLWIFHEQLPILAKGEGIKLLTDTVNSILFLATTATGYWFASRGHSSTKS